MQTYKQMIAYCKAQDVVYMRELMRSKLNDNFINIILNYIEYDPLTIAIEKGEQLIFPKILKLFTDLGYTGKHWKVIEKLYLEEYCKYSGTRYHQYQHCGETMNIYYPIEFNDIKNTVELYCKSDEYADIRTKIDDNKESDEYAKRLKYFYS